MSLERMQELIRKQDMCVLTTVQGKDPHASLMAYLPDAQCRRLYLVTSRRTRKFQNLLQNPKVSLLVDDRGAAPRGQVRALTLEGTCRPLLDPDLNQELRRHFSRRHPQLAPILNDPHSSFLEVEIKVMLLMEGPQKSSRHVY